MILAVAVTKEMPWRTGLQEFSNVYHYDIADGSSLQIDDALIDRIVQQEKLFHANTVAFKRARSWGPVENAPAGSFTRRIKDLTGNGGLTPTSNMYKELAILVQWPLGRYGSKNRPQRLRKWYHTMASNGYALDGHTAVTAPAAGMITAVTALHPITFTAESAEFTYPMSTATDHQPIGLAQFYPYLEHRQLGR